MCSDLFILGELKKKKKGRGIGKLLKKKTGEGYQRAVTCAEHCQTCVRNRSCRKCSYDNVLEAGAGYRNNPCQILQNSPFPGC